MFTTISKSWMIRVLCNTVLLKEIIDPQHASAMVFYNKDGSKVRVSFADVTQIEFHADFPEPVAEIQLSPFRRYGAGLGDGVFLLGFCDATVPGSMVTELAGRIPPPPVCQKLEDGSWYLQLQVIRRKSGIAGFTLSSDDVALSDEARDLITVTLSSMLKGETF
jgi:hypothetical protein